MLNQQAELLGSRVKPLILVVDDHEDNILYACKSLELFGYQHMAAYDAHSALDLAEDKLPDLILMDIVMPKVSGISLTRRLKSNLHTSRIPIIAVTGLAFSNQKEQILNSGFDDYLCKPYLMSDLEAKITHFFN